MAILTAIYDANVLYPAPLRDLLMRLALTGLFQARWTAKIHEEWLENLLAHRPDLQRARLEKTRDLMNAAVRDCLVTDYEDLIPTLTLLDPDDRHVLAAAIHAGAGVIVTFNRRHFPTSALQLYGIEAQSPDSFILHWLEQDAATVCAAVRRQRLALQHPPKSIEEVLETLEQQSLPQTVTRLRAYATDL